METDNSLSTISQRGGGDQGRPLSADVMRQVWKGFKHCDNDFR